MNIDDGFESSLMLNGSPVSKSKRRDRSNAEHDERQQKQATYSSLYSRQTNNSSLSSNGLRLERLRRKRSVVIRSQEALTATRTTDEPSPGSPPVPSSADSQLSTRVHPGLEMMRSGSNRSVHSAASATKSTGSTTSRRAIDTDSIPLITRESFHLLQELTEVVTRLEQRIIQMEERATLPLLRTLPDSPRGDDESVIDLKLSLNS